MKAIATTDFGAPATLIEIRPPNRLKGSSSSELRPARSTASTSASPRASSKG